jgi:hypothetical protein
MIGGRAPSAYLAAIQGHKQVGLTDGGMDDILASHDIEPAKLREDDYEGFFARRRESLLTLIERAMGKAIDHGQEGPVPDEFGEMEIAA